MKRTMKKKLSLNRETLRTMAGDPLAAVVGGVPQTAIGTCQSCYQLCTGNCTGNCSDNCTITCPSTPDTGC